LVAGIVGECEEVEARHRDKDVDWFNDDYNYNKILGEALLLKAHAMGKLAYWMENQEVWARRTANGSRNSGMPRRLGTCK
jgi:hypothetical protein